jgi:DNA repair exonuclease SbcCD ATPase subunit
MTWHISDLEPGLIFVSGDNRLEPTLGANGAGKSSIFEGLVWTLYGRTSRNIKTPTLVSWGQSKRSIYGQVRVIKDNISYVITRSPSVLTIEEEGEETGRTVVQSDIDNFLGLTFESFIWLVYIPQFGVRFFDLSPTEKLSLFTSIMEDVVEKWVRYSERAKTRATEIVNHVNDLNQDKQRITGLIQGQDTREQRELSRTFERTREENIEAKERRILHLKDKIELARDRKINIIIPEKKRNDDLYTKTRGKLENLDSIIATDRTQQQEALVAHTRAIANRDSLINNMTEFEAMQDACPTCTRSITGKEKRRILDRMEAEIERARRFVDKMYVPLERANAKLERDAAGALGLRDDVGRLEHDARQIARNLEAENRIIDESSDEIINLKADIKALKSQRNVHKDLIKKSESKTRFLSRYLRTLEAELEENNKELEAVNYWKKGFKDIRIALIERALKELEAYVNNNLSMLGLDNWSVTLSIDSETAKGKVKRELAVMITTTDSDEQRTVPFDVWSGGEGQRLRLAGTLGLIDFIENYNNVAFDIEVYDEPTTWLSNVGISNLLEALAERAEVLNRRILVVDHRDLASMGEFTNTVNVIKDDNGTHIE